MNENIANFIKIIELFLPEGWTLPLTSTLTPDDLFNAGIDDLDWVSIIVAYEAQYSVEIPDAFFEHRDLTLGELSETFAALPRVDQPLWIAKRFQTLYQVVWHKALQAYEASGYITRSN